MLSFFIFIAFYATSAGLQDCDEAWQNSLYAWFMHEAAVNDNETRVGEQLITIAQVVENDTEQGVIWLHANDEDSLIEETPEGFDEHRYISIDAERIEKWKSEINSAEYWCGAYFFDFVAWVIHDHKYTEYDNLISDLYDVWITRERDESLIENMFYKTFFIRWLIDKGEPRNITDIYESGYIDYWYKLDGSRYVYQTNHIANRFLITSGVYDLALQLNSDLRRSVDINPFITNTTKLSTGTYLAYVLYIQGYSQESLDVYESLDSLLYVVNRADYYAAYYNSLGAAYYSLGRYKEYVETQLRGVEYARNHGDRSYLAMSLNNLYRYYEMIGAWDEARNYLEQALENAGKDAQQTEVYLQILFSQARLAWIHDKDYILAEEIYNRTHYLAEQLQNPIQKIRALADHSQMLRHTGQFERAAQKQQRIIDIAELQNIQRSTTEARIEWANIAMDQLDFERARSLLEEIEDVPIEQYNFWLQLMSVNARARFKVYEQRYEEAQELMAPYISEVIDRLQTSSDYQSGRSNQYELYLTVFSVYADILFREQKSELLLSFLDQQANLTRSDFYNHHTVKANLLTESELRRDHELTRIINDLRDRIRTTTGDERSQLQEQLLSAVNHKNALQQKIQDVNAFEPANIGAIQKGLAHNEAIIHYSMLENRMYIHRITRKEITGRVHKFDDETLTDIDEMLTSMFSGNTDLLMLHKLYNKLLEPEISQQYHKLTIIPDNFLHHLPVEIFPIEQPIQSRSYGSSHYLIEDHAIYYRHSLIEYQQPEIKQSRSRNQMLAFGVSRTGNERSVLDESVMLPQIHFAREEAESIGGKFQNKSVLVNSEATVSSFMEHAPESRYIHLASHSEVSLHDPLYSVVYFGESDQNRNYMYAYELFGINLNADMIVLSSCESGAGNYQRGNGVSGLSRAFRFAGTQSMVLNLWPVRDQTALQITRQFYEGLAQKKTKSEALREAKITYLNHSNSDPFLWGAMVIYGNDEPIRVSGNVSGYTLVMISGLILLLIFGGRRIGYFGNSSN